MLSTLRARFVAFGLTVILLCGAGGAVHLAIETRLDQISERHTVYSDAFAAHMTAVFFNEEARAIANSYLVFNDFNTSALQEKRRRLESTGTSGVEAVAGYTRRARETASTNLARELPATVHDAIRRQLSAMGEYHIQLNEVVRAQRLTPLEIIDLMQRANETRARLGSYRRSIGDALIAARDEESAERQRLAFWHHATGTLAFGCILALVFLLVTYIVLTVERFSGAVGEALEDMKCGRAVSFDPKLLRIHELKTVGAAIDEMQANAAEIAILRKSRTTELESRALRAVQVEAEVASFSTTMSRVSTTLQSSSTAMRASSQELTAVTDSVAAGTSILSSVAEQADLAAASVAQTATEMSATSAEIMIRLDETVKAVSEANEAANISSSSVSELNQAADRIGEVVLLIGSIAEQTNLLALNAAIEAMRSGAAGRSFAVVASEVKSLAGRTSNATLEITRHIEAMQRKSRQSVAAIRSIANATDIATTRTKDIASAIHQQSSAMHILSESAEASYLQTLTLRSSTTEMRTRMADARESARRLEQSAQDVDNASQDIDGAVRGFMSKVAV